MKERKEPLVSVIIPVYNVHDYIRETLDSVKNQTYQNWECVCANDCSTDDSADIVREYVKADSRFRLVNLKKNGGAAAARNAAIKAARGDFLAFVDSDDLWKPEKLEHQMKFMLQNGYTFTCTDYGKVNEKTEIQPKVCHCEKVYTYDDMLKECPGNSTIIYSCKELGKVYGPLIRRRNDFAMWLQVIKKAGEVHGLQEILGYHRVRANSISVSKRKLVKYQFDVYRKIEHIGLMKSCYLTIYKIVQTLLNKNG